MKQAPDHIVFINALREVLGLGPLPYSTDTQEQRITPWWPVVQSQGSRRLDKAAFIDELKVYE